MSKKTEAAKANENRRTITVEVSGREQGAIIEQTRFPETFMPKGHEQVSAYNAMLEEFGVLEFYQDFTAGLFGLDALKRQFSSKDLVEVELTMPTVRFFLERFAGENVPMHPSVSAHLSTLIDRVKDAKMKPRDADDGDDAQPAAVAPPVPSVASPAS